MFPRCVPECLSPAQIPTSPAHKHGKTSAISDLCQNLYGKNHKGWVRGKMSLRFPSGLTLKRNLAAESDFVSAAKHVQNRTSCSGRHRCTVNPAVWVHRWCQNVSQVCWQHSSGRRSQNIEGFSQPSSSKHFIYPPSAWVSEAGTRWSLRSECWLFLLADCSKNVGWLQQTEAGLTDWMLIRWLRSSVKPESR